MKTASKVCLWSLSFAALAVFLFVYDPYAGKGRDTDFLVMILSRVGLANFFGGI
ncbi:hypothetical protein [Geopseudomonas guangdongensis]|uniref:Uncharacterized protein n=1 Tax=Geopseudomonas guangdongensis TaxID=1245526 RepID=A0A1H2I299_9GAMM|nr:hypothetical protein [Pseudomonas guangdongensis]SDU38297.1 hypothetical protein SAMN05216580_2673 [Pseudomonas guangdongensis]